MRVQVLVKKIQEKEVDMVQGKVVLVIDDDKAVCELIKFILRAEGCMIVVAHNGEEGLKAFKKLIPDLIILDMNMPKMGGVEFYEKIANPKDSTPLIPTIVLTGRGEMKSFFEGINVAAFIAKPFRAMDFLKQVQSILSKQTTAKNTLPPSA